MNFFWRAWKADRIAAVFDREDTGAGKSGIAIYTDAGSFGTQTGIDARTAKKEINAIMTLQKEEDSQLTLALMDREKSRIQDDIAELEKRKNFLARAVAHEFNEASALAKIAAILSRSIDSSQITVRIDEKRAIKAILDEALGDSK